MNLPLLRRLGTAALLCVLLAACGSGDSDDDDTPPEPAKPVLRCAP